MKLPFLGTPKGIANFSLHRFRHCFEVFTGGSDPYEWFHRLIFHADNIAYFLYRTSGFEYYSNRG